MLQRPKQRSFRSQLALQKASAHPSACHSACLFAMLTKQGPLAWLINNDTLCKPSVGISNGPAQLAEGILNMVRATTRKPARKAAARKGAAKKAARKGAVKKTARKAMAKKRVVRKAAAKKAVRKATAKKAVRKAVRKAGVKKAARKAAPRKVPPPPPPGPTETA